MERTARARFLALQNAIKFKGRANPKALIGAMIAEFPDAKEDMKGLMADIDAAVDAVNDLSVEEQRAEIERADPNYFAARQEQRKERQEARHELPPLKGADQGKVVTRIPPEPSKYNHLGHALSFLINYLYAQKYDGKAVLRFEDTNPEKASQEFVDAMREDVLSYLDVQPAAEIFVSDDMELFYEAAATLIAAGDAYACTCTSEMMSKLRRAMEECPHRAQEIEETEQLWHEMRDGERTDAVLRLRVDMRHKNAVMRDPVLFRVVDTHHYRQGDQYKVWPMYDFENALEDAWCGVTHVLRSNEFETRIELHKHIRTLLGLRDPVVQQYGRFNITGATTQGREIRAMIDEGRVTGWDDPRLITLRALRRRGIVKEAFYELAKRCGMSKTQTNLDFGVLAAINRQILDEQANRYSFVADPIEITVEDWPESLTSTELKLHPHTKRGGRPFALTGAFHIAKHDAERITHDKVFRLIDTANIRYTNGKYVFQSEGIDEYRSLPEEDRYGLVHFLPTGEHLPARVLKVVDHELVWEEGLLERNASTLAEGALVQLERYGFARLDSVENGMYSFWFAHP